MYDFIPYLVGFSLLYTLNDNRPLHFNIPSSTDICSPGLNNLRQFPTILSWIGLSLYSLSVESAGMASLLLKCKNFVMIW